MDWSAPLAQVRYSLGEMNLSGGKCWLGEARVSLEEMSLRVSGEVSSGELFGRRFPGGYVPGFLVSHVDKLITEA
jgi:hypothetical protein